MKIANFLRPNLILGTFFSLFFIISCQKESNKNKLDLINSINPIDLLGSWKCTGKFEPFDSASASNTIDVNPSNDYAVYTIQSGGKYLVKNDDIFSLQNDGKWVYDSIQNQIEFFESHDDLGAYAILYKNHRVYWHITKLSNDSLFVIYDKSIIDPDGIKPTTSAKRARVFVKQ